MPEVRVAIAFCSSQNKMRLSFFLLFISCESTVKSFNTTMNTPLPVITTVATEAKPSSLQLVATPDYPVAAGQRVDLHCRAFNKSDFVTWSWQRLKNQNWQEVGTDRDLTLTKPEQSGLYRCSAKSRLSQSPSMSPNHTVFIISMHATVSETLGIAAFFLSVLALIINIAILFWLGWQFFDGRLVPSNTAAKGFPGPEKSPKGSLPQADSDGDVYMNYTSTNQAYSDLDPTNMTGHNVYSSLS